MPVCTVQPSDIRCFERTASANGIQPHILDQRVLIVEFCAVMVHDLVEALFAPRPHRSSHVV
jgi:hypothetical protein